MYFLQPFTARRHSLQSAYTQDTAEKSVSFGA